MNELEKAARQALEALESMKTYAESAEPGLVVGVPAIAALRRALEQPAQDMPKIGCVNHDCDACQARQEPVAWRLEDREASEHYRKDIYVYYGKADFKDGADPCAVYGGLEPLYTRPQAREPLTREQVKALIKETGYDTASLQERADFINGIRHAEAAHGIKGDA